MDMRAGHHHQSAAPSNVACVKDDNHSSRRVEKLPCGIGYCKKLSFQMPMACSHMACIKECRWQHTARLMPLQSHRLIVSLVNRSDNARLIVYFSSKECSE